MSESKIMTLHPEGKAGVNIDRGKYDQMVEAIRLVLQQEGPMSFMELVASVKVLLEGRFEGSIAWYCTSVKLDLQARGELLSQKVKGKVVVRLA